MKPCLKFKGVEAQFLLLFSLLVTWQSSYKGRMLGDA